MTPAEQPMPDRLYDTTFDFILKWLTIMADSDGVGLNSEQFTIRMSTCKALSRCQGQDRTPLSCQDSKHQNASLDEECRLVSLPGKHNSPTLGGHCILKQGSWAFLDTGRDHRKDVAGQGVC